MKQPSQVTQVTRSRLDELVGAAQTNARRRSNLNLHPTLDDPIQRLAIAMQPDTLIRPHRHRHTWELLLPLRGRFVVVCFDETGVVSERIALGETASLVELPAGQWHAVLSLDSGSVIFEVKHGPYMPTEPGDFAPWLAEDSACANPQRVLAAYAAARVGERLADCR